jgi:hypothetical protein
MFRSTKPRKEEEEHIELRVELLLINLIQFILSLLLRKDQRMSRKPRMIRRLFQLKRLLRTRRSELKLEVISNNKLYICYYF